VQIIKGPEAAREKFLTTHFRLAESMKATILSSKLFEKDLSQTISFITVGHVCMYE